MSTSEYLDICAVKHCNGHLDKRCAKSHPSITNGFLCPVHEFMHVEPISLADYMAKAYLEQSKRSEPVVIHEIPARTHRMSQWTNSGYDRLEADFINIFGGELCTAINTKTKKTI